MCLRAESVDDYNDGVRRISWAKGLSDDDGGVGRGRGIRDASKGSETTTETAGPRRRSQGIYDNDGNFEVGR